VGIVCLKRILLASSHWLSGFISGFISWSRLAQHSALMQHDGTRMCMSSFCSCRKPVVLPCQCGRWPRVFASLPLPPVVSQKKLFLSATGWFIVLCILVLAFQPCSQYERTNTCFVCSPWKHAVHASPCVAYLVCCRHLGSGISRLPPSTTTENPTIPLTKQSQAVYNLLSILACLVSRLR